MYRVCTILGCSTMYSVSLSLLNRSLASLSLDTSIFWMINVNSYLYSIGIKSTIVLFWHNALFMGVAFIKAYEALAWAEVGKSLRFIFGLYITVSEFV